MARQFNQIPPICEQAEYHMFQREKVEVQLPELFHKIGARAPPTFLPESTNLRSNVLIDASLKRSLPSVLRCGGHDMVAAGLWDHLREI